ncbi:MAG TPA: hypothetical protein VKZ18_04365 [Polyangia bacterium]|nr:hypothetical protein [Polyangia bacterium]
MSATTESTMSSRIIVPAAWNSASPTSQTTKRMMASVSRGPPPH